MLVHLRLERFKNFKDASLHLGPLSILIGSNASGKSNIRDAFRFLHGLSRGYSIAEILGEKYVEGGFLQWAGVRGGVREATYPGASTFSLTVTFTLGMRFRLIPTKYHIEVDPDVDGGNSRVVRESLYYGPQMRFDSHPPENPVVQKDAQHIRVRIRPGGDYRRGHAETFIAHQPVLTQIADRIGERRKDSKARVVVNHVKSVLSALQSMRFLDLDPDAMRKPSLPGQTILGDRGENLSSVLQAIYKVRDQRAALIEWIRELTPMDARDFEFVPDQTGRILVSLVEQNGHKTSAYSASDGTLRFLAMIAALMGPKPAQFYFFEELDSGLHPARLYLLLQLIEQKTFGGSIQMVASTHSPQLMRFLSPKALKDTSLIYRLPDSYEGRIRGIMDMPDIEQILEQQDLARLHESGWFEDAMVFSEAGES
ncbi:MAG: AAA family ATPase [Syntrophobacteraceae bacterium]|nr:AAA family ATPase [Syntrophobacteraceae bacterium]